MSRYLVIMRDATPGRIRYLKPRNEVADASREKDASNNEIIN